MEKSGVSRSMSQYYSEVGKTEIISREEERELIEQWKFHKDGAARDKLINSHLRFVVSVARKRTKDEQLLQDLIAAGNIGLLVALDRYDLNRKNIRFLTYAGFWVQLYINNESYINTLPHVPIHRQKVLHRKAREAALLSAAGGTPEPLSKEGTVYPLDAIDGTYNYGIHENPHEEELTEKNGDSVVRRAIAKLSPREQTVVNCYYGIKDEPRTLAQISNLLSISPERARQIKIKAMNKLKDIIKRLRQIETVDDMY